MQFLKYERLMLVLLYKTILCRLCHEKNIAWFKGTLSLHNKHWLNVIIKKISYK